MESGYLRLIEKYQSMVISTSYDTIDIIVSSVSNELKKSSTVQIVIVFNSYQRFHLIKNKINKLTYVQWQKRSQSNQLLLCHSSEFLFEVSCDILYIDDLDNVDKIFYNEVFAPVLAREDVRFYAFRKDTYDIKVPKHSLDLMNACFKWNRKIDIEEIKKTSSVDENVNS